MKLAHHHYHRHHSFKCFRFTATSIHFWLQNRSPRGGFFVGSAEAAAGQGEGGAGLGLNLRQLSPRGNFSRHDNSKNFLTVPGKQRENARSSALRTGSPSGSYSITFAPEQTQASIVESIAEEDFGFVLSLGFVLGFLVLFGTFFFWSFLGTCHESRIRTSEMSDFLPKLQIF